MQRFLKLTKSYFEWILLKAKECCFEIHCRNLFFFFFLIIISLLRTTNKNAQCIFQLLGLLTLSHLGPLCYFYKKLTYFWHEIWANLKYFFIYIFLYFWAIYIFHQNFIIMFSFPMFLYKYLFRIFFKFFFFYFSTYLLFMKPFWFCGYRLIVISSNIFLIAP